MKNLKLLLSLIAIFLIVLTSCKKETTNTKVTADELLNYQMYWVLTAPDNTQNLRFLYFEKIGNEVKATLDGINSRIIKTIVVENNILTLNLNDNGSVVYTFEFAKSKEKLTLVSSKFYNVNNPNYKVNPAKMGSKAEFSTVKNKAFKDDGNLVMRFNTDTWLSSSFPNLTGTYYEFGVGGWKGKINGIEFMGFFGESESYHLMYFQKYGDKSLQIVALY